MANEDIKQKLTVILSADVKDYGRLMAEVMIDKKSELNLRMCLISIDTFRVFRITLYNI